VSIKDNFERSKNKSKSKNYLSLLSSQLSLLFPANVFFSSHFFFSLSSSHVFLTHTHPRLFNFFSIFLFFFSVFLTCTQHLFIFRLLFFDLSNFFIFVVIFVVSLFSSFFSDEWNEKIWRYHFFTQI